MSIPLSLASSAIFCWSLAEIPMISFGGSPLSCSICLTYRVCSEKASVEHVIGGVTKGRF